MKFRNDCNAFGELLEGVRVIEWNNQPGRCRRDHLGMLQLDEVTPDRRVHVIYQPRNEVREADTVENPFARLEDTDTHEGSIISN